MRNNRELRQQNRGRKRLAGDVVDNLVTGIDRLVADMGISQEPCTPVAVLDQDDGERPAMVYTLTGLGVIFVIAVTNCPLS